ncbi:MAG: hypothetical protein EBZ67_09030, partial [Chitinophagia bacterium]|nr:hypothetical protein [Chitinophagia bacterium]
DSLFTVLKEQRSVEMEKDDLPLVKHFPGVDDGPRVIANLVFTLPRLGGSKSLEYAVHKGDTLELEYSILRGKGFDEIDVLEGKEVRFTSARNTKKQVVSNVIVVEADGVITVNLTNKSPIPSKGKLLITLRPALVKLSMRYLCDTLSNLVKTKVILVDTLPETLFSQYLLLTPRANITRLPAVSVSIPMTPGRRYLAWGYWVGTQSNSIGSWRALAAADTLASPLALYLTREMRHRDRVRLPVDPHRELRFDIRFGEVPLSRIATGSAGPEYAYTDLKPNYGSITLKDASTPLSIGLELENLSKYYACRTQVDIVGIYAESREEEREVEEKTCREYIKISIL